MSTFLLHLESATQYERIENVESFVGLDESGSFGILAGHSRMMSLLTFGLARFRVAGRECEYVAVPGALAYFVDGQLHLSTRRYLRGKELDKMTAALRQELQAEEDALRETRQSVKRLEEEMLKRLWKLSRGSEI